MTQPNITLYLPSGEGWMAKLRLGNLALLAALPALLLLWRGGADIALSLIAVSFLVVVIANRAWDIARLPVVAVLLGCWLLLNLVISPFALDPMLSFSRSLPWLRFVLFFAAVTTWLLQSRRDIKIIATIWLGTIALAIVDSLYQLIYDVSLSGRRIFSGTRLSGPMDRPNIGMLVARLGFPLVAAAVLLNSGSVGKVGKIAATAALAVAGFAFILLTGERAASLLTAMGVVTATIILMIVLPRLRIFGLIIMAAGGMAVGVVLLLSERIRDRVYDTIGVFDDFWTSPYGELFAAGLKVWQAFPLLGAGMKNFQPACQVIAVEGMRFGCHPHPHNIYIEWLADTGLLGMAAFILVQAALFHLVFSLLRRSPLQRLVGALLAGALVLVFFPLTASQSFFSNWPAILLWCSLSMTIAVARLALRDGAAIPARPSAV